MFHRKKLFIICFKCNTFIINILSNERNVPPTIDQLFNDIITAIYFIQASLSTFSPRFNYTLCILFLYPNTVFIHSFIFISFFKRSILSGCWFKKKFSSSQNIYKIKNQNIRNIFFK